MFGITPFNRRNMEVQRRARGFDMDSLFENFFHDSFHPVLSGFDSQMKVDIKENENDYSIEADLPGVDKKDINIELRNDVLSIEVQRNEVTEEERNNYIRKERRSSSMSRSFRVENIKHEDVKAKFENGVLSISLPKTKEENQKQHRIDIN